MLRIVFERTSDAKELGVLGPRRIAALIVLVPSVALLVAWWLSQPVWKKTPDDLLGPCYAEYWEQFPNRWTDEPCRFWARTSSDLIETGPLVWGKWHGYVLVWRGVNEWNRRRYWFGGSKPYIKGSKVEMPTLPQRAKWHPYLINGRLVTKEVFDPAKYLAQPMRN